MNKEAQVRESLQSIRICKMKKMEQEMATDPDKVLKNKNNEY